MAKPSSGFRAGLMRTLGDFSAHDDLSLAGALAFYTALSLAPLLVVLLKIASLLGPSTRQSLVREIQGMVGQHAGQSVKLVMDNAAKQPGWGSVAGTISLLILIFSASGVFAQLQSSLNRIWNVRAKPSEGIWNWIRKRLLSIGMVIALAFVLLVSLGISAFIGIMMPHEGMVWSIVNFVVSLFVFVLLFALIYKYLPDVKMDWATVWTGAITTAILFTAGKTLIGLYLAHSSTASSYGAAGSLLVLLLWVYYSSLLVFFGAELTQVRARMRNAPVEPDAHAEWDVQRPTTPAE